ncbi:hypothetical protein X943_003372 [Babesia divergens]|uniref:VASt domain-containing protein n=1 Tax=Babesia divergens TaxID=32595 RepID=A0AAD9LHB2_BABDI|nr:hypothetical protein X943_003372 [Babesia divergens]
MKLDVSYSSNLSFLVTAYDSSYASAKALSRRLRSLLSDCKEASVLESLVEFPGPYLIDNKLKCLHLRIHSGLNRTCCNSVLSVSWINDANIDSSKLDSARLFRGDIGGLCAMSYDDADSDTVESSLNEDPQCDLSIMNPYSGEDYRKHVYIGGLQSRFNPPLEDDAASVNEHTRKRTLRQIRSMTDINIMLPIEDKMRKLQSNLSTVTETPFHSYPDNVSGLTTPSMLGSPVAVLDSLSQLCAPEFKGKGCTRMVDVSREPTNSNGAKGIGLTQHLLSSSDDLTEQEKALFAPMCVLLRRMLKFIVEASSHELQTMKHFDSSILESMELLEGIASDSLCMITSLKEQLKRYTSSYMSSLTEYQSAAAKFTKLEKILEGAFLGSMSSVIDKSDLDNRLECGFKECYSHDPLFQQHRRSHRGIVKELLNNPRDFVRYTNYVEQLCLAGYLHDNLIKNRDRYTRNLTGVLGMFADHYPRCVFDVESDCLGNLASVASTLLQSTMVMANNLNNCVIDGIGLPMDGVLSLCFSVNVDSVSLKHGIHASIAECFDTMKVLAKKLSKFHLSQIERLSRFGSRYACVICDVDLNVLFKSYHKYHKHLHSIWWSIYSTIAAIFPTNASPFRRFMDTQQPVIGDFRDLKLPFNMFDTVLRQFEAVVKISKEHAFDVCNTSVKLCSERQSWSKFIYSLANKHRLHPIQLLNVIGQFRETINAKPKWGLPFPSDADDSAGADISIPVNHQANLIALTDPIKQCKSSAIINNMLSVIEYQAEAVVDYNEVGYNFHFNRGDTLHVRLAGNTSLWYGHTASGVDRWFPAKYVKLKVDCGIPLFRRADVECSTYLDDYRVSQTGGNYTNKQDAIITLSSKAILKQSLVLSKLGLQGKVEYEFKCSICRKIVLRGTLYLTKSHLGFISSFNDVTLFGNQTSLTVPMKDIVSCELNSNKAVSFYVRIVLRSGDIHVLHSVTNARRIRDAITELAGIEEYEGQEIVGSDNLDSSVSTESLKKFFGVLEPLSKTAPPVCLQVSLEDFFKNHLSDNTTPGSRIADSRLWQNAFDFGGTLEPVVFDWSHGGIQFQKRNITYSFKLKEGKFTSLIPRQTCGKSREDIKYALIQQSKVIYESTNYVFDIPYANYFYTVLRITATALSRTTTMVKCEYDVKFVKSTVFGSVITAEASDRLLQSLSIICKPTASSDKMDVSAVKISPAIVPDKTTSETPIRRVPLVVRLRTLLVMCAISFAVYTSWLLRSS